MRNKSFTKKIFWSVEQGIQKSSGFLSDNVLKAMQIYVGLKQWFSLDASLKKSEHLFVEPLKWFSEQLYAFYVIYCVEGLEWGKHCVFLDCVVFSALVLLHQPHLQAHAWHPACPRTRRLVGHSRVHHPVSKGHVSTKLLTRPLCQGDHWLASGCSYRLNSDVFMALECFYKWFKPRKKLRSQYY